MYATSCASCIFWMVMNYWFLSLGNPNHWWGRIKYLVGLCQWGKKKKQSHINILNLSVTWKWNRVVCLIICFKYRKTILPRHETHKIKYKKKTTKSLLKLFWYNIELLINCIYNNVNLIKFGKRHSIYLTFFFSRITPKWPDGFGIQVGALGGTISIVISPQTVTQFMIHELCSHPQNGGRSCHPFPSPL